MSKGEERDEIEIRKKKTRKQILSAVYILRILLQLIRFLKLSH